MKILLGGDSFAELENYSNHYTSSNYNISDPKGKDNYDASVTHWVEMLAQDVDAEVVTHGVPGAGVSSSGFVALQQLITGNYDAFVFCVSHHCRTISNKHVRGNFDRWKQAALADLEFDSGIEVYQNNRMYSRKFPDTHLDGEQGIFHLNAEEYLAVSRGEAQYRDFGRNTSAEPNEQHYLDNKVGYSYIHDAVTTVVTLDAYCKAHNIPVVFASAFPNSVSETILDMGIPYKHFPFYEAEVVGGFSVRHEYPSHYSTEEHKQIYAVFKHFYPEYQTMFTKKN